MMAAPIAARTKPGSTATRIGVVGELVSRPYVDMTAEVMRSFGASVEVAPGDATTDESLAVIGRRPALSRCETTQSSPMLQRRATSGQPQRSQAEAITVEGLTKQAMQGDVGFCDVLQQMGCEVQYHDDGITVAGVRSMASTSI